MTAAGALVVVWAAAVVVVSLRTLIVRAPAQGGGEEALPTVLLRPCAGDEPGLEERLCSGAADLTLLVVAEVTDPALPAATRAAARLRERGAEAEVRILPTEAANRKAAVLGVVIREHPGAIVINADSDVDLGGFELRHLVDPLRGPEPVGAVWAPPVEVEPPQTLGDRISHALLDGSLHAFPLLATLDGAGLVGKLFAVRADRALAAGALQGIEGVLGEDVALSRGLRAGGFDVRPTAQVARARPRGRSVRAVVDRYTRWFAVVRGQRAALMPTYPLLFGATTPLVAAGLWLGGPSGWAVAASVLAVRLAVGRVARRRAALPGSVLLDLALADVLVWVGFVRALWLREVRWRDRRLSWRRSRLTVVRGVG